MKQLIIATKNPGKAKEFKDFFKKFHLQAVSLLDLAETIPDIEETGTTFEENAAIKAEAIANRMQIPVLADDSGLVIDALDGRPGIYSARYAGEAKDDKKNVAKVLDELNGWKPKQRQAHFVCVLAVAVPNHETLFYKGTCTGSIATEPKGENGFGYDPVFIPSGYSQTMAELAPEEKNAISHRKHAIAKLETDISSLIKLLEK
ncbi:XTP/dITP diphosphatase [Lentibacillus sp. N15]|uniref:XTP/dITP diphosphatase n=1 Tax=Lentibacillus songyuanensis TaxID=3136161 RepID=UPI0031B9C4B0